MTPCFAYFCMRSGRIPSDAKRTVRSALPTGVLGFGAGFAVTGAAKAENRSATIARRTNGRKRRDGLGTRALLLRAGGSHRTFLRPGGSRPSPTSRDHPEAHTIAPGLR